MIFRVNIFKIVIFVHVLKHKFPKSFPAFNLNESYFNYRSRNVKTKKSDLATVLIIETIKIKVNLLLYDVKSVLFLNFVLSPNHDVKAKRLLQLNLKLKNNLS